MRLCAALSTILATIVLAGASAPAAADDRGRSHSRLEIITDMSALAGWKTLGY